MLVLLSLFQLILFSFDIPFLLGALHTANILAMTLTFSSNKFLLNIISAPTETYMKHLQSKNNEEIPSKNTKIKTKFKVKGESDV